MPLQNMQKYKMRIPELALLQNLQFEAIHKMKTTNDLFRQKALRH